MTNEYLAITVLNQTLEKLVFHLYLHQISFTIDHLFNMPLLEPGLPWVPRISIQCKQMDSHYILLLIWYLTKLLQVVPTGTSCNGARVHEFEYIVKQKNK